MELPEHLKYKAIFVQGGAFKTQLPGDSYPRYYFVLNKDPSDEDAIVLTTTTTHFELHRNCPDGDDVHIDLSVEDYEDFTQNCLICCNWKPRIIAKDKLINVISKQNYTLLKPLPKNVLDRILNGISKSSTIEPRVKSMILPDSECI